MLIIMLAAPVCLSVCLQALRRLFFSPHYYKVRSLYMIQIGIYVFIYMCTLKKAQKILRPKVESRNNAHTAGLVLICSFPLFNCCAIR